MRLVVIHSHWIQARAVYTLTQKAAQSKVTSYVTAGWAHADYSHRFFQTPAVCGPSPTPRRSSLKNECVERDKTGGEEGTWEKQVEAFPADPSISRIGPRGRICVLPNICRCLPVPDHRGFRSSLPNPASHGGPSASPHMLVPAAFPAGGAAGTKGRRMHRINELNQDKSHKAGIPGGRRDVELTAPCSVPQSLP